MTRNTIHFVERFKPSIILFTLLCCLFLAGCAEDKEQVEAIEKVDQSEQAIRSVIEKEFNAPDEKYKELSDSMWETGIEYGDDAEGYKAFTESAEYKAVFNYTEDTYASYFTENGYDNFVNLGQAFYYTNFAGEYTLSTSDVEINQSENGETLYNFTFQVNFTDKNGETSQFDIKGNAIAPEEGKIGKIDFKDDGFKLTQAIEANE